MTSLVISSSTILSILSDNELIKSLTEDQKKEVRKLRDASVLNLTQHKASPEQIKAGVVDLAEDDFKKLGQLLTFDSVPTREEMVDRAHKIGVITYYAGINVVMIGGAPYFMPLLERELLEVDCYVLYAFSQRVSEEEVINGKTVKTNVFRHLGFVKGREEDEKPSVSEFFNLLEWAKEQLL